MFLYKKILTYNNRLPFNMHFCIDSATLPRMRRSSSFRPDYAHQIASNYMHNGMQFLTMWCILPTRTSLVGQHLALTLLGK